jgi:hypothetical protein
VPNAASNLFERLEEAQKNTMEVADREMLIADLVVTLALFPSRPPGARWYSERQIDEIASKVDRRRDGIDEAIEKIKTIFSCGAHGNLSVRLFYAVPEC